MMMLKKLLEEGEGQKKISRAEQERDELVQMQQLEKREVVRSNVGERKR
jgi:hypothetical protein